MANGTIGDAVIIDVPLVQGLVATQFPQWAHLPVRPVENDGHDNRTFRLGSDRSVRLPSHARYEPQVQKEQRWLPRLAPHLPLPIPTPLAMGSPSTEYPFRWSVYGWIEGEIASAGRIDDLKRLAESLADFLVALQSIDAEEGPGPGAHNFHRGGPLGFYESETLDAVAELKDEIDREGVLAVWEAALAAPGQEVATWLHGDVAASNLLVRDGRLRAVIDFGICGVGDPSCDLKMAWTFFEGSSRLAFRERLGLDSTFWARGRGWALWKCLKTLAEKIRRGEPGVAQARHYVAEIVADHRATA